MSWTKVYAHDQEGTPTFGTIDVLFAAVREGKQVRMLLKFSDFPQQEYFTPAENIWIIGRTLSAQKCHSRQHDSKWRRGCVPV
jgi:hypothetical protein